VSSLVEWGRDYIGIGREGAGGDLMSSDPYDILSAHARCNYLEWKRPAMAYSTWLRPLVSIIKEALKIGKTHELWKWPADIDNYLTLARQLLLISGIFHNVVIVRHITMYMTPAWGHSLVNAMVSA
jgi:hypothetical protein